MEYGLFSRLPEDTRRETATAIVSYDPITNTGDRARGYAAAIAGMGWYHHFQWASRSALPRTWSKVHDQSRGDTASRIAMIGDIAPPKIGPHITIFSKDEARRISKRQLGEGAKITFEFATVPFYTGISERGGTDDTRQGHIFYAVYSEDIFRLRQDLGLNPYPKQSLHLTVATWNSQSRIMGSNLRMM